MVQNFNFIWRDSGTGLWDCGTCYERWWRCCGIGWRSYDRRLRLETVKMEHKLERILRLMFWFLKNCTQPTSKDHPSGLSQRNTFRKLGGPLCSCKRQIRKLKHDYLIFISGAKLWFHSARFCKRLVLLKILARMIGSDEFRTDSDTNPFRESNCANDFWQSFNQFCSANYEIFAL